MKLLKFLLALVGLAIVALVVGSFFLSPSFEIVRTHKIKAAHPRVIHHMASLTNWTSWWPWNREGQNLRVEGDSTDPNAKMSWSQRPAPGYLVITKSSIYAVEFDAFLNEKKEPLKGTFEFKPLVDGTDVTWKVSGSFETPVLGGYLALMADSMHGGMLSWGLKQLSETIENDSSELEIISEDESGKEVIENVP